MVAGGLPLGLSRTPAQLRLHEGEGREEGLLDAERGRVQHQGIVRLQQRRGRARAVALVAPADVLQDRGRVRWLAWLERPICGLLRSSLRK